MNDSKTSLDGKIDIFIIKINYDGTYCWTKRIGGNDNDYANSVTTDALGNIYVTGYFYGASNFGADWGINDTKTSRSQCDIYITKINPGDNTYLWTKTMGGNDYDIGREIKTDTNGNIYVTGSFNYTVNFGADFGLTDSKTSTSSFDIFILKLEQP